MNEKMAYALQGGEGETYWVLGDLYTFKATGKQTAGVYTIIDQEVQPQGGPPPHVHHREDEAFYVLDGKFSFINGDKEIVAEQGAFIYIPKGTVHTFKNIGAGKGRLLVMITPAGLEEFFYAIGTPARGTEAPPPSDPAIIDKLMQLAGKYEMDILLPDAM